MADSVIGALRVLLGLDTAAFSTGLKDATGQLNQFGNQFSTLAKRLGIAAAATAFVYDVKRMIDSADELGKMSQKFGIPVESLSALKYAANLADVSFESLGKGLGKLSKAMLSGATDPAGEAAKNFQALGVSVTDTNGNLKSTEAVFGDVAQRFSMMEDGAAKTAMAIRIFGKSGADLIPLLNQGKTGIAAVTDEARKLGIVISGETAIQAEKFNDTMKKIHATHDALALKIAEALLPALQKIADMFVNASKNGGFLDTIIKNLITEQDLQQIARYAQYWENFLRIFAAAKDVFRAITGTAEEWRAALARADDAVKKNVESLAALERSFLSLGKAGAFESLENLPALMDRVAAGTAKVKLGVLGASNAIDQFIKSQQKSQAAQEADNQAAFTAIGVKEAMRVTMEADAIALANNITLTDKQRLALKALSDQAAANAVAQAGIQITMANLTPYEKLQEELKKINQLEQENAISAETAHRARMKNENQYYEFLGQNLATAAGNFSQFFATFGKGNKEMFLLSKAFAITQAIISTMVAANKALELGPILGPIAMAGMIAAGMANVATIIAQKPPAMRLGGSFQIGGAGGIDSKMVPIMATPGERVSVDQNKYGDTSAKTVTVAGINPKDYYRGDVLRDLVANLNAAIGDGLKIKMA